MKMKEKKALSSMRKKKKKEGKCGEKHD